MSQALRVALIDWNQSVRSARRLILDATPNIEVVFESDGDASQLQQLPDLLVDVILIDQQLENGSGIDAFVNLRSKYQEPSDIPPAVLSATYDFPEIRFLCLAAGMHGLVSIEAGPEALIRKVASAASREKVTDLEQLEELARHSKISRKSDFSFTQAVNALPIRKRALVDKLALDWSALQAGARSKYAIEQLDPLVAVLGCLTASELVIRLLQNGFLDGK